MKKYLVYIFCAIIAALIISYCYFTIQKSVPAYSSNGEINIEGTTPGDLRSAPVPPSKVVFSPEPNGDINIEGITPYDLMDAPVPQSKVDFSEEPLFFEKGTVDLSHFYSVNSGGYYIDMALLGYTLMDNVPTAVVLLSEKSGGTGYFPSIALYQSPDKFSPEIVGEAELKGDRISIKSLTISPNKITLVYRSWSEDTDTKVNLVFKDGKLIKN
jgi:hypothetical protein